jgi:hypothetical protein
VDGSGRWRSECSRNTHYHYSAAVNRPLDVLGYKLEVKPFIVIWSFSHTSGWVEALRKQQVGQNLVVMFFR